MKAEQEMPLESRNGAEETKKSQKALRVRGAAGKAFLQTLGEARMLDRGDLSLSKMCILLVEDSHDLIDKISKSLKSHIDELYIATNGRDAMAIFDQMRPDIVISNVKMPIMDGISLAEHVKDTNPDTPVILLDTHSDNSYVTRAVSIKVDHYLFKPLELDVLIDRLNDCVEQIKAAIERNRAILAISQDAFLLGEYKKTLDLAGIISISDKNSLIKDANGAFLSTFGYERNEVIGQGYELFLDKKTSQDKINAINTARANNMIWRGGISNVAKSGERLYFNLLIVPILDQNGEVVEYIDFRQDITSLKKSYFYNEFTGLPNRKSLLRDIKSAILPATAILDIDDAAEFRILYGREVAQKMIKFVADSMQSYISQTGVGRLYKLVGDEFAILVPDYSDCQGVREYFKGVLVHLENQEFEMGENTLSVTARVGISTAKDLPLNKASVALKQAKREYQSFVIYEDLADYHQEMGKVLNWALRLKKALRENRITPFFQPVIDIKTGAIVKYECLMRIIDENGEPITSGEFIHVAQMTWLYSQMSRVMIEKSCRYFADKPYDFSVNITAREASNVSSREFIKRILAKTGTARRIILELSQAEQIEKYKGIAEFVEEFRMLGCRIALDDFGVGYSNFSTLANINFDFIKIDGSIISKIDSDRQSLAVAEAITLFAKKLGARTVAEFVHNKTIEALATKIGIDYGQGFLYSKPSEGVIDKQ
ncbi:MAG: EAL domain-containing protein [Helicobacteraceae bacterium]|jgi:PAS domain S-box-containing protein|nr:EAL domain-containing protein [Helicobacteraceae bacterium]